MRSIRLSLTVYFLVLLALALGGASWFVYNTAGQTLREKRRSTAELVQAQYQERCREERDRLDKTLVAQAQTLGRLAQFQFDHSRLRLVNKLGLVTAPLSPFGYAALPLWAETSLRSPLFFELYHNHIAEIRLSQSDLLRHAEGQDTGPSLAEYFQIDTTWGGSYHSQSLGGRSLPLDLLTFDPEEVFAVRFDDMELETGVPLRRVMLKTSMVRFTGPPPPVARPERRGERPRPRDAARGDFPPRLSLYVQCAYDTRARDTALAEFASARDDELARLDDATANSLASLRNRLLAVAVVTFLAAGVGCLAMVRVGLAPLRRLSFAVSRVSAKDFRLPYSGPRPPRELQPIVARLQETLDLLKRAFAREKQATADISHELRTPLAALLTTTEMGLRRTRSAEEYQELLRDCQASARQMSRAVERLLALARLDAGVDTLRLQAVDAAALARRCLAVVRPLAEARGLRLAFHVDGEAVPQLTTDPDKFSEVLTNLLHNAVQYNRPGGDIDVRLARQDGRFELAVHDTGVGIAPEARAHLFERFWRADPSRGADGLHAGLGLAIVKGYVDLMGGTISVESNEGEGSTFRVHLPV